MNGPTPCATQETFFSNPFHIACCPSSLLGRSSSSRLKARSRRTLDPAACYAVFVCDPLILSLTGLSYFLHPLQKRGVAAVELRSWVYGIRSAGGGLTGFSFRVKVESLPLLCPSVAQASSCFVPWAQLVLGQLFPPLLSLLNHGSFWRMIGFVPLYVRRYLDLVGRHLYEPPTTFPIFHAIAFLPFGLKALRDQLLLGPFALWLLRLVASDIVFSPLPNLSLFGGADLPFLVWGVGRTNRGWMAPLSPIGTLCL